MATFIFWHSIQELLEQGVDFTKHLYVPEIDSFTREERHDRGDHNHMFKRIAQNIHNRAMWIIIMKLLMIYWKIQNSGCTHAALICKHKQNLKNAERLLSYHVVASVQRHGHPREAPFVQVLVNWHKASDGHGLSQLKQVQIQLQDA